MAKADAGRGGFLKQYAYGTTNYVIIDNSSPIQYSSSSAVGMKDSNNAVPEYDSRRNGHYAKSEQFLHITIVLLKADSIGGHGDGGEEKGMERGRRPRPASPSGSLKINSDIYDIRIEGGREWSI